LRGGIRRLAVRSAIADHRHSLGECALLEDSCNARQAKILRFANFPRFGRSLAGARGVPDATINGGLTMRAHHAACAAEQGFARNLRPKMPARWSSAMPDRKALRDLPEPSGAPRLLNAAAWLERLAALEAEFKTALSQDAAAREQNLERRRGEVTPR
jgi:hypothetical protein